MNSINQSKNLVHIELFNSIWKDMKKRNYE